TDSVTSSERSSHLTANVLSEVTTHIASRFENLESWMKRFTEATVEFPSQVQTVATQLESSTGLLQRVSAQMSETVASTDAALLSSNEALLQTATELGLQRAAARDDLSSFAAVCSKIISDF